DASPATSGAGTLLSIVERFGAGAMVPGVVAVAAWLSLGGGRCRNTARRPTPPLVGDTVLCLGGAGDALGLGGGFRPRIAATRTAVGTDDGASAVGSRRGEADHMSAPAFEGGLSPTAP